MAYDPKQKTITEIVEINASAEKVWSALTDLEQWSEWNPFIILSEGKVEVGQTLKNTMKTSKGTMTFKPRVLQVEKDHLFEWRGHLFIPGLFDGTHSFKIETLGENKVRLIQHEYFKGMLSGVILKDIGEQTSRNFDAMNQALKQRAEND